MCLIDSSYRDAGSCPFAFLTSRISCITWLMNPCFHHFNPFLPSSHLTQLTLVSLFPHTQSLVITVIHENVPVSKSLVWSLLHTLTILCNTLMDFKEEDVYIFGRPLISLPWVNLWTQIQLLCLFSVKGQCKIMVLQTSCIKKLPYCLLMSQKMEIWIELWDALFGLFYISQT